MAVGIEYLQNLGAIAPTGARTATAGLEGMKTASEIANDQLRQQTLAQAIRFNEMQQPYVMAGLQLNRERSAEDWRRNQEAYGRKEQALGMPLVTPGMREVTPLAGGLRPSVSVPTSQSAGLGTYTPVPTKPVGYTDTGAPLSLVQSESGGKSNLVNQWGYGGRLQFGQARLNDAIAAGVIPAGTTVQQFAQNPQMQQAVETWHFNDLNNYIRRQGLDKYVGQTVGGNVVTPQGMISGAHLGGSAGLKKHLETGGKYNPADPLGTRLSDYMAKHSGPAAAPGTSGFSRDISALGGQLTSGGLGEAAGGFYATPTGRLAQAAGQAAGYFTSTPERQAEIARYEDMRRAAKDWFYSPQTVNALTSRPELMQEAQRDPLAFYQKYSASTDAPTPAMSPAGVPLTSPAPELLAPTPMGATSIFTPPGVQQATPASPFEAMESVRVAQSRDVARRKAEYLKSAYERARLMGDVATMDKLQLEAFSFGNEVEALDRMNAITQFTSGNIAPIASVLKQMTRGRMSIEPRSDGTFNIYDGKTKTAEGLTKEALTAQFRLAFDQDFKAKVEAQRQAEIKFAEEVQKTKLSIWKEAAQQADMQLRELSIEQVKAALKRPDVKVTRGEDSNGSPGFVLDDGKGGVSWLSAQPDVGIDGKPVYKNPLDPNSGVEIKLVATPMSMRGGVPMQ
jgi:hypothetical protein